MVVVGHELGFLWTVPYEIRTNLGLLVCAAHFFLMSIWVWGEFGWKILLAWPGIKRGPYGSVRG
jgi:hypothetical protein